MSDDVLDAAALDRAQTAIERIEIAAQRARELEQQFHDERELRDRAIMESIDSGALSERRAGKAAGLTHSGIRDLIGRFG